MYNFKVIFNGNFNLTLMSFWGQMKSLIFRFWEEPLWTLFLLSFSFFLTTFTISFWIFLYIFGHLKKTLQIFENMPNLLQNDHFALKCTSLLSNVHFKGHFLTIKKIQIFEKHTKLATKWTFCSQKYIFYKFEIWNLPRRSQA